MTDRAPAQSHEPDDMNPPAGGLVVVGEAGAGVCVDGVCEVPPPAFALAQHFQSAGVQDHQAHPVRDHVVHLPCDPDPFGVGGPLGR